MRVYAANMTTSGDKKDLHKGEFTPADLIDLPKDIKDHCRNAPPSICLIKSNYIREMPNEANVIVLVSW